MNERLLLLLEISYEFQTVIFNVEQSTSALKIDDPRFFFFKQRIRAAHIITDYETHGRWNAGTSL